MITLHKKPSPFFTYFLGAAIFIVGLLAAFAMFGEWGFIVGFVALTVAALVNYSKSSRLKQEMRRRLPARVMKMLNLNDTSNIFFKMKVNLVWKNDKRQVRLFWLIIEESMIFLDYFRIPPRVENVFNFREKDEFPIREITRIEARMKKFTVAPEPVIAISVAGGDVYEVTFYSKGKCKMKFDEIVNVVRDKNNIVEIQMQLPAYESLWNKMKEYKIW